MVPTRRQTLATIGLAVSVAGCSVIGEPDLVIENKREQSVTADIDITRMSDMRMIVRTDRSIGSDDTTALLNRHTAMESWFHVLLDVVDQTHQDNFPELSIPFTRSDGRAVRALDRGVRRFGH